MLGVWFADAKFPWQQYNLTNTEYTTVLHFTDFYIVSGVYGLDKYFKIYFN